ncbi:MAG: formylglycine-generating enzyme family protein [Magnetococcales bacterium]|nr:formylglycine-generating enzyme family protein [Magnetococcales bacterium]
MANPRAPVNVDKAQPASPPAKMEWRTDAASEIILVRVPGGSFEIGCGAWSFDCHPDEGPAHKVTVGGFEMGKYEVTWKQWRRVLRINPPESDSGECEECPVEGVSWNEIQQFLTELNAQSDGRYRLPTEAEWEYACRSGGKPEKYCGGDDIESLGWYGLNSGFKTHPVGQKAANGFGLHDMSGNVWEWTCSVRGGYADGKKSHTKCGDGVFKRINRGGGWGDDRSGVRSVDRNNNEQDYRYSNLGFRVVRN